MHLDEPTFPPLLTGVPVDGRPDPFVRACEAAAAAQAGAGEVFWSRASDRLALAIVLEPEVDLAQALHMHFVSMVAFGDAFGALGPAEVGLYHGWPDRFLVNGASIGRARLGLPRAAAPQAVPDWMVVGIEVALRSVERTKEPGHDLDNTTLEEEGCGDLDRTTLLESFCRHFLVWVHTWEEEGFRPVHDAWMGRVLDREKETRFTLAGHERCGTMVGLDDHGNLLLKGADGTTGAVPILDLAERTG